MHAGLRLTILPSPPFPKLCKVAHFLSVDAIANTVRSTHGLALLMAAILHDYRHPGVRDRPCALVEAGAARIVLRTDLTCLVCGLHTSTPDTVCKD